MFLVRNRVFRQLCHQHIDSFLESCRWSDTVSQNVDVEDYTEDEVIQNIIQKMRLYKR